MKRKTSLTLKMKKIMRQNY